MRLVARADSLIAEVLHFADAHERLTVVVDRARRRPRFTADERDPARRVPGCSSSVWLIAEMRDGRCWSRSDADSHVVRGLVTLLTDFFDGATPAEITINCADPLEITRLATLLTPTRRHGLAAVHAAIKTFAESNLPPHTRAANSTAS